MVDPTGIERAAATAWPAALAEERDGWLLRASPRVPHRRVNSALPLAGEPDVAAAERFYAARGLDAVVAVAPGKERAQLDAALDAAGWEAEGHTEVLAAEASAIRLAPVEGVKAVDPHGWPNEVIRDEVLARARDEVFAFAEGQRGAVLCVRTGDLAGVFRLHVAPEARRGGVGSRLLAACATVAPLLYAQVERDNAAARALFARAGFTRSHGYHYRRRPPGPS